MDLANQAPDLIIPLPITPSILWIVWVVILIIYATVSWVLMHHWKYYGVVGNNRIFAKGLYFVGGIAFLVVMAILIGAYTVIK